MKLDIHITGMQDDQTCDYCNKTGTVFELTCNGSAPMNVLTSQFPQYVRFEERRLQKNGVSRKPEAEQKA